MAYITELTDDLIDGIKYETSKKIRTKSLENSLYVKSRKLAEQLINELEKELKIMLEVE